MRRGKQSALHARWTENRLQSPSPFECAMIYTCDSNNVDRVSKHILHNTNCHTAWMARRRRQPCSPMKLIVHLATGAREEEHP